MSDTAKYNFEDGIDFARELDKNDPLREYRRQFFIPEPDTIYLDGNSLGRLPNETRELLKNVTDNQWGTKLIRSWNEGWYDMASETGKKLAQIIGASPGEVIPSDSTSINLFKLVWAAVKSQQGRYRIVSDMLNFPTDLYILEGIVHHLGPDYELSLAKTSDGQTTDMQSLGELIDNNTALVVLSHVAFKSAFMYDMEKVTQLAHRHGALILWDLSHSAGAVPVELNKAGADLAVGCTYKYLNGGPGSPAFLYVANNLVDKLESPFWGWFGAGDPFAFGLNYKPAGGIRKFLVGTPPVLSLAPVSKGLDIMLSAGMDKIRKKSILQTEYLIFLTHKHLTALGFTFGTPLDYNVRGSHISLQHDEAYRICHALIQPENGSYKVIPDFREPNNIRFGIAPLYTSFEEFFLAVEKMRRVVEDNIFLKFDTIKNGVT